MIEKAIITIKNFKKISHHHYGVGWSSALKFFYYSLFNLNTFVVYGTDFNTDLPFVDLGKKYRILLPTERELDDIRRGLDLPREFYYDKIHHIKKCYLVLYGDEVAYIHWVYSHGDPSRFLKLREGTAELNYNTTLPKFRGQGLMAKMMAYISADLKRQGYIKVVGVINKNNPPALRSAEKAGWSEITRIKAVGPFNRKVNL